MAGIYYDTQAKVVYYAPHCCGSSTVRMWSEKQGWIHENQVWDQARIPRYDHKNWNLVQLFRHPVSRAISYISRFLITDFSNTDAMFYNPTLPGVLQPSRNDPADLVTLDELASLWHQIMDNPHVMPQHQVLSTCRFFPHHQHAGEHMEQIPWCNHTTLHLDDLSEYLRLPELDPDFWWSVDPVSGRDQEPEPWRTHVQELVPFFEDLYAQDIEWYNTLTPWKNK